MSDCLICTKHRNDPSTFVFEDEDFVVAHYPVSDEVPEMYQGHLFVEPKRHVTSFSQLDLHEARKIGELIHRGVRALENKLGAEHVYVFTISHMVPHLHVHLVPRYPETPEEYWDRKLHDWPKAPKVNSKNMPEVLTKLKNSF